MTSAAVSVGIDTQRAMLQRGKCRNGPAFAVDANRISAFAERDPANLPWDDVGVDLVLEVHRVFTTAEDLQRGLGRPPPRHLNYLRIQHSRGPAWVRVALTRW